MNRPTAPGPHRALAPVPQFITDEIGDLIISGRNEKHMEALLWLALKNWAARLERPPQR